MKARIKGTDDPFRDIETVEIKGVCGVYFTKDVEFELIPPDHWQDVRERAAIAAMQGMLASGKWSDKRFIAEYSVEYADTIAEILKGELLKSK